MAFAMVVAVEINLYGTNVPGKSVKLNLDKKHLRDELLTSAGAKPQFTQILYCEGQMARLSVRIVGTLSMD